MSCVQLYQVPFAGSIEDKSSAKAADWKKLITTLNEADGILSTSWALQEEDSKIAGIAANFESYNAQQKWASSARQETVQKLLKSLSSGDVYEDTIIMPSDAEPSLGAKTVELVSWIYPSSKVDDAFEKKVAHGFIKFAESISKSEWASGGMLGGWSVNTFKHDGEESRRYTGLIGWQSVQAHYDCKKTPTFTDHIHWLENGDTGVEMVHYKYSAHAKDVGSSL